MTKFQLISLFFNPIAKGKSVDLCGVQFTFLNNIEKESGSGSTFNVSGIDIYGNKKTVFISTLD